MGYSLGSLKRFFLSSIYYCSNDCFTSSSGINLRKTSLGSRISIKSSILAFDDGCHLYSLDAFDQTFHLMDQNAITSNQSTSSFSFSWISFRWRWKKSWSSSQYGRLIRVIKRWKITCSSWRRPWWVTWYQRNSSPSDHWNDWICLGKYFKYSFLSSFVGFIIGSWSIGSCIFGENYRRRYCEC